MLWGHIGEQYAGGNLSPNPGQGRLSQIRLAKFGKPKQPQDSLGDPRKDSKPSPKGCWIDLGSLASANRWAGKRKDMATPERWAIYLVKLVEVT